MVGGFVFKLNKVVISSLLSYWLFLHYYFIVGFSQWCSSVAIQFSLLQCSTLCLKQ